MNTKSWQLPASLFCPCLSCCLLFSSLFSCSLLSILQLCKLELTHRLNVRWLQMQLSSHPDIQALWAFKPCLQQAAKQFCDITMLSYTHCPANTHRLLPVKTNVPFILKCITLQSMRHNFWFQFFYSFTVLIWRNTCQWVVIF